MGHTIKSLGTSELENTWRLNGCSGTHYNITSRLNKKKILPYFNSIII